MKLYCTALQHSHHRLLPWNRLGGGMWQRTAGQMSAIISSLTSRGMSCVEGRCPSRAPIARGTTKPALAFATLADWTMTRPHQQTHAHQHRKKPWWSLSNPSCGSSDCDPSTSTATTSSAIVRVLVSPFRHSAVNLLKGSFIIMLLAMASCSPRHDLAERREHIATAHESKESSDKKDVSKIKEKVRIVIKNDTIRIDSIRTEWRYIHQRDTVYMMDSIYITDTLRIVEYKDPRSYIQKTTDKIGNICILIVVFVIIVQLLKINKK